MISLTKILCETLKTVFLNAKNGFKKNLLALPSTQIFHEAARAISAL